MDQEEGGFKGAFAGSTLPSLHIKTLHIAGVVGGVIRGFVSEQGSKTGGDSAALKKCLCVCACRRVKLAHVFSKWRCEGTAADKQLSLRRNLEHQRRVFIDCRLKSLAGGNTEAGEPVNNKEELMWIYSSHLPQHFLQRPCRSQAQLSHADGKECI
ncbi:hypothetical protein INR49_012144 [Caranx melampygus]|nr:hypothetical protein INR49_012144 [Caranx melampygus]